MWKRELWRVKPRLAPERMYTGLHALDIATGEEKFGGPVEIQASVPGTGEGSVNGVVAFDPRKENSRPGLLLSQSAQDQNSVVYMAHGVQRGHAALPRLGPGLRFSNPGTEVCLLYHAQRSD